MTGRDFASALYGLIVFVFCWSILSFFVLNGLKISDGPFLLTAGFINGMISSAVANKFHF